MFTSENTKNNLSMEWKNAWKDKNITELKNLLKLHFIPDDIHAEIQLDSEENIPITLMDILLENNIYSDDIIFFKIADKFLLKGAELPAPLQEEKDFLSTEDYFIHLVRCPHDLYIALRKKPILIQEKDSKDQTLLHHAARVGHDMDSMGASLILFLLLSSPNLDFNIKDKNGNTPLHIAALNSNEPITCKYIFPNFLRTAFIAEFDFDTLNNQGQTILHIAARTTFENINNVEQVLNCVPNIPLNTLSTSGSTALYYALNHLRLKEAHTLLEHNANPKIFGKDSEGQERNPWDMVNQHIEMICEKLAPLESTTSPTKDDTDTNFFDRIEMIHLNETKKELLLLKKMIENSSHAKTCTEIWIKWMTSFFSKKEKEFPPTKQNSHHLGY